MTPLERVEAGRLLRKKRKEMGLRLEDVAKHILSKSALSRIERGEDSVDENYFKYGTWLGVDLRKFLAVGLSDQLLEPNLSLIKEQIILRQIPEALSKLDRLPIDDEHPFKAYYHYLKSMAHYYQKKFKQSETEARKAIEYSVVHLDKLNHLNILSASYNILSSSLFARDRVAEGLQETLNGISNFNKSGDLKELYPMKLLNCIVIFDKLDRLHQTGEQLEELHSVLHDAEDVEILIQANEYKAKYLTQQLNQYDQAIKLINKARRIARNHQKSDRYFELTAMLGKTYFDIGRVEEAEKVFDFILSLEKDQVRKDILASVYNEYGRLLMKKQNMDSAKKWFDKACKLCESIKYTGPRFVEILISIGDLLFEYELEKAIGPYEKALGLAQEQGLEKKQYYLALKLSNCYEKIDHEKYLFYSRLFQKLSTDLIKRGIIDA